MDLIPNDRVRGKDLSDLKMPDPLHEFIPEIRFEHPWQARPLRVPLALLIVR
jgi:hypothetical protein